ncbi:Conidial yellow pigment biosynthesis polyketide synthase [Cytospora mali]|uniref:Conidial yellow pigment biosynthesis polyketide synthase n=1 Tax=Cytospora mali TaxID=578113 RepID=A0A194VTK2_CYTMA|nr:Conidial yellow pigment biosynthesis polyketide synthase [Valsa mali]
MAQKEVTLYLFGDQTYNVGPHLKELLLVSRHSNGLLYDFLRGSYDAIRVELYRLPSQERDCLPRFTCVEDLVLWASRSPDETHRCVPLTMAVSCMYQLAEFISQTSHSYPSPQNTRILGLCTGALPAAAVSCARSVLELLPLAMTVVAVAFKTGICAADAGRRATVYEPHAAISKSSHPWSLAAAGPDASTAVQNFCMNSALPVTTRPFISAQAPNGITISGPPRSLARLIVSEEFKGIRSKELSIYAPFHASHLFSKEDVTDIIQAVSSTEQSKEPTISVLSSSSGAIIDAHGFNSLLEAAVEQILLQQIHWGYILEGVQNVLRGLTDPVLKIIPVGTVADQLIYTGLRQTPFSGSVQLPPPGGKPSLKNEPCFSPSPTSGRPGNGRSKIAIVGMSGRFPGANSTEAFWDLLRQGLDVHREVPPLHWNKSTHFDPAGNSKNTSATPYGCWLDDPAAFDARFFNVSPREAPQIDPAQRIALMTAYEAIEQAGIVPDATPSTRRDRVGVFYGVTSNDWMETNSAQNIDTYFIPGGNRAFIPGRINYFFKFSGPSYAVDTACSSSLAAVHIACNALWERDIDTAITGGTNVLTNPDFTAGLDRGYFLSRTGNCKTFDDGADGYCRGEGVGTVILKRLEDAIADHDPILGLILGAYTNHSAEAESITRPHSGAQRAMFTKILNSTQDAVDATSISYVEMHGTGTQAGDASEMQSVLETFAPSVGVRGPEQPLYLGSAKANIGHGEAASGVSSLVKVLLMMRENTIPPHCGIKSKINHKFPTNLTERNVMIAREGPVPWNKGTTPRRVFVNNFSAAGGNTALLLEDAPRVEAMDIHPNEDTRTSHLVAISAKNGLSLQNNLKSMLQSISQEPGVSLGELSYTTTARRIHHPHRVMLAASSVSDLCTQMETAIRDQVGATRPKVQKVVFAFTGQGAQFPGMGKLFLESFTQFRGDIRRLDHTGQKLGFPSIMPIFQAGNSEDILGFSPVVVQLANVCMQIALSRLLAIWNITPTAVVGHSLGEYAALNVAGVLSDADTVYLVGKRAELLHNKCSLGSHSMLVVSASVGEIKAALRHNNAAYEFACVNSPTETVLAGLTADMDTAAKVLTGVGLRTTTLKVPYAFHSSQVDPILVDFGKIAAGATYLPPKMPVICPLSGGIIDPTSDKVIFGPEYLVRHCREPVNMLKALQSSHSERITSDQSIFVEVGPHPAVSGMVKATLGPQVQTLATSQRTSSSRQSKSPWQVLTECLKKLYCLGSDIRWSEYHRDFPASHKVISLPAYSWDLKEYWIQYVNDWSLRKGDPPLIISAGPSMKLESTTIHRVVEESSGHNDTRVNIVVEADIARPDLNPLVQGHCVDNIPLCTPSVYADIALTLGKYLAETYRPQLCGEDLVVDVANMTVSKALVAKPQGPQPLQVHSEVDWNKNEAITKFVSFDSKGQIQEHARCVICFRDRWYQCKLQQEANDTKEKMQALRQGIASETTARFNRAMVYRMIRPLAHFHADYRAIDEVVLNSNTLEASSRVSFGSVKRSKDDRFHTHPAIIDALTQSCGFTMNCNDGCDLDVEVFMNHGWGSFQIFEEIDFEKAYTTYTRMVEGKDHIWHGDVVVFDGEKVVAAFQQLAIQGVPRRVLQVILSLESGKKAKGRQTETVPAPMFTATPSTPAPSSTRPNRFSAALQIISEESGIAIPDLTMGSLFSDLGVDSLLSLTITARFREELDVDVDSGSMLLEFPTIGDLKTLFQSDGYDTTQLSEPRAETAKTTGTTQQTSPVSLSYEIVDRALQIVSEESGVAVSDLTDDTHFTDSGIDSLLSLVIVSRFREELELDIDHESLLMECPTVESLKSFLLGGDATASDQESTDPSGTPTDNSSTPFSPASTPSKEEYSSLKPEALDHALLEEEKKIATTELQLFLPEAVMTATSTSLVIQGSLRTCTKTVFLFPDGSGSATSYAGIPRIAPDTCVIALNSPFLKDPDSLRVCPLAQLMAIYLTELRRRQPNGPYQLGGWSAGGILAYRAAQTLISQGEEVTSLALIDSPPPLKGLDRLPDHFYDFCKSLHLFGGGQHGRPSSAREHTHKFTDAEHNRLIAHFNASIDVLHEYHAAPLPVDHCPKKVSIIWAPDTITDRPGVKKLEPHPNDTEGMKFLTERRTDFGTNGWDKLFPGEDCEIKLKRVENAHHFSMMREPYSAELAAHVRDTLV